MSDKTKIFASLIKVQSTIKNPSFTKSVDYSGRSFSYAELNSILDLVRPLLAENNLAITQSTLFDQDRFILSTKIVHEGGEFVESTWPLPLNAKPQEIGSNITYARRYMLCAMLGIQADSDDDGAQAKAINTQSVANNFRARFTKDGVPDISHLMQEQEKIIQSVKTMKNHAPQTQAEISLGFPPDDENPIPPAYRGNSVAEDMYNELSNYKITFGKHTGKTLLDLGFKDANNYAQWLLNNAKSTGKELSGGALKVVEMVQMYANYVQEVEMDKTRKAGLPVFDANQDQIPF